MNERLWQLGQKLFAMNSIWDPNLTRKMDPKYSPYVLEKKTKVLGYFMKINVECTQQVWTLDGQGSLQIIDRYIIGADHCP